MKRIRKASEILKDVDEADSIFDFLKEAIYDGIMMLEPEGRTYRIVDINTACRKMLDVDDALGSSLGKLPAHCKAMVRCLKSLGKESKKTCKQKVKDRHLTLDISRTGKGLLVVVFRDVTIRENLNLQLSRSEEYFRTVFNNAVDAMFIMDGVRFIDCNAFACKVLGYTKDEIVGKTPIDFSPDRQITGVLSKDMADRMIKKVLSGEPGSFEWIHQSKSGSEIIAEVNLTSFVIGEKKLILAVVRDITQRKKIEDDIRRRNEELELFHKLSVNRELKMIELKKKIDRLKGGKDER